MAILIMNETKEDCGRKDSKIFLCPYTRHFERCSDGCKVISIPDITVKKIFLEEIEQPIADTLEVERSEWLQHINEPSLWSCSQCGLIIFSDNENDRTEKYKWCSRCGADMRGKND